MIIHLNNIKLDIYSSNIPINIKSILANLYNTYSNALLRSFVYSLKEEKNRYITIKLTMTNKGVITARHLLYNKENAINFSFIKSTKNTQLNEQTYYSIASILKRYLYIKED